MIPILFDKTETTFTSNGIGRLSDALSCIVTEERNGQYELKMVYPITGVHYSEITHSRIIFAQPAEGKSNQAFRIYKITKPSGGRVTVLAQHISYQLTNIITSPFEGAGPSEAAAGMKSNASTTCPFTITTNITSATPFKIETPTSIRNAIGGMEGSFLELYGGEIEWDMYNVCINTARGSNRGKVVSYGKNITSMQQEENIDKVITGIYPFYSGDVPTEEELRAKAQEYLTKNTQGIPRLTIKAAFIDEENHVPVNLCDTVTVYYAPLGVSMQAEVVELEYNVLLERYETMTVGAVQDSILDAVITTDKKTSDNGRTIEREKAQTDAKIKETNDKIDAVTYEYVTPQVRSTGSIADGNSAIIMSIYFKLKENTKVRFGSTLNFRTTATTQGNTTKLNITYGLDAQTIGPIEETYADGDHVLTLDYLTSSLSAGSHVFSVAFGLVGGSLS